MTAFMIALICVAGVASLLLIVGIHVVLLAAAFSAPKLTPTRKQLARRELRAVEDRLAGR